MLGGGDGGTQGWWNQAVKGMGEIPISTQTEGRAWGKAERGTGNS